MLNFVLFLRTHTRRLKSLRHLWQEMPLQGTAKSLTGNIWILDC